MRNPVMPFHSRPVLKEERKGQEEREKEYRIKGRDNNIGPEMILVQSVNHRHKKTTVLPILPPLSVSHCHPLFVLSFLLSASSFLVDCLFIKLPGAFPPLLSVNIDSSTLVSPSPLDPSAPYPGSIANSGSLIQAIYDMKAISKHHTGGTCNLMTISNSRM